MKTGPKVRLPSPPRGLSPRARRLWRDVVQEFDLEPHDLELLALATESLSRYEAAKAVLDLEGTTFSTTAGEPRLRPEVAVERDSRNATLKLLRALGLDVDLADDHQDSTQPAAPVRLLPRRAEL